MDAIVLRSGDCASPRSRTIAKNYFSTALTIDWQPASNVELQAAAAPAGRMQRTWMARLDRYAYTSVYAFCSWFSVAV